MMKFGELSNSPIIGCNNAGLICSKIYKLYANNGRYSCYICYCNTWNVISQRICLIRYDDVSIEGEDIMHMYPPGTQFHQFFSCHQVPI